MKHTRALTHSTRSRVLFPPEIYNSSPSCHCRRISGSVQDERNANRVRIRNPVLLLRLHKTVFDNGEDNRAKTQTNTGVTRGRRNGQRWRGHRDGDGPPGADVRHSKSAVVLERQVVDTRIGRAEEHVDAHRHEDRHDGPAALRVELDTGGRSEEMGRLEIAQHVCGLLRCC